MRVVERDGFVARCEAKGIERTVSLFLLQHEEIAPGDHVMVHVGYAIQKMSRSRGHERMGALRRDAGGGRGARCMNSRSAKA